MKLVLIIFALFDLLQAIKLGLIETEPKLIAICQRAIADAKAAQLCDQTVELVNRTGCVDDHQALGTANVADMFFHEPIQGAVTGRCDEESLDTARLAYFWDLPLFTRTGTTAGLNDRIFYPTVVQMPDTSVITMAQALVQLMNKLGLTEMVLVGPKDNDLSNLPFSSSLRKYVTGMGIRIKTVLEIDEPHWDNVYESNTRIRTTTKLIVIDAEFTNLLTILTSLNAEDIGSNGYLIILLCQETLTMCSSGILSRVSRANIVVLSPLYADQENRYNLVKQWVNDDGSSNIFYSDYLSTYNACYGFCYGTTLVTPPSGKKFTDALKSKSFEGKLGSVVFDGGANAIQEFVFQRLVNGVNWSTIATAKILNVPCSTQGCTSVVLEPPEFKIWENVLKMPITPCFYMGNCTSYMPLIIGLSIVGILVLVVLGAYFYRRQKRLEMFRMHWKVPKTQLKVIENKASKSKAIPAGDESKASTLVSKRRAIQAYALIGTAKAEFMVLKQLKKIRWIKPELKFVSELKRISHDNCANFLGLCYNEGDRFYILHNLVERASLDNFIFDSDFTMDNTFKSAFLRDIINGLQYLHKSIVGYHGLLSCQNCLIDANWVLKLTNFGVVNLLNTAIEREQLKLMEIIPFNAYFTTSPENLQDIAYGRMFPRGSKQGDIYSLGMLLYHILFRRQPYENNDLTAKEVIEAVKQRGIKPDVTDALPEEKPLIDIMDQCWAAPENRPKLRILNQIISSTFESSKGNLIDQMLNLNNRHAQQLEKVVSERTEEFETQKRMNARLLQQLLPASIAEKLMAGELVQPRSYEAATVLFCQLVDFGRFLGHTAPHNVIRFLNEIFTRFDEVIGEHDAYKVETTGETYMVASGVPTENDNRHVFEIAEIALQLRDVCSGYKVEHMPDWKVQVRLGFHCGTLAAGVVGIKAPRFCLFGDTVNFASRMQSNCPPNQIQMSEPTALLLMPVARYKLTKRGIVRVKGKGDVNTYWLNEHISDSPPNEHKDRSNVLPPQLADQIKDQLLITNNKMEKDDSTETPPDPVHSGRTSDGAFSEVEDTRKSPNNDDETSKISDQIPNNVAAIKTQ